ncbi:TetR/AcrR family transcriptional regulator [Aquitalea sp.]|uniref:TetR/AcrR family transcriptional regulator n=1 Tax=Aquitalea sp. TaxID=1872623 RepID=UPI00338D58EA
MRQRILDAAQNEFVQHGFSGARLDNIAEQANTNKRMVVYHFHSKKELHQQAYGGVSLSQQERAVHRGTGAGVRRNPRHRKAAAAAGAAAT